MVTGWQSRQGDRRTIFASDGMVIFVYVRQDAAIRQYNRISVDIAPAGTFVADQARTLFSPNWMLFANLSLMRFGGWVLLGNSQLNDMSRQYTLQRAPVSTSVHIDYAAELNETHPQG